MNCPKCDAGMERITHQGIDVDRCSSCGGIWFDLLERETLARLEGSESIDTGDATLGRRLNRIERIDCPACRTPMIRMVDPVQSHVWYEACKVCHGVFLDAGEFGDLKERTILDRLRDLFATERG